MQDSMTSESSVQALHSCRQSLHAGSTGIFTLLDSQAPSCSKKCICCRAPHPPWAYTHMGCMLGLLACVDCIRSTLSYSMNIRLVMHNFRCPIAVYSLATCAHLYPSCCCPIFGP
jgi:hypothetical protein